MSNIKEFKNVHYGQDIWIIAAGPSMNYVNPSFFSNKITIGINRVNIKFDCDYLVAKDGRGFKLVERNLSSNTKLILSRHESGNLHQSLNQFDGECWFFDHPAKPMEKPDLNCISPSNDKIVVSYSTITSGIHLAAYMGAANIMLCGHDCGTIDGESTIEGYYSEVRPHHGTDEAYVSWLAEIENHTALVSNEVSKNFNCSVHSLNPFINLNLEGHKYVPSNQGIKLQRKLNK